MPPPENRRRGEAGRGAAQDCWPPKPDLAINSTRGERYTERQVEKFFLYSCSSVMLRFRLERKMWGAESFMRAGAQQVVCASTLCH